MKANTCLTIAFLAFSIVAQATERLPYHKYTCNDGTKLGYEDDGNLAVNGERTRPELLCDQVSSTGKIYCINEVASRQITVLVFKSSDLRNAADELTCY